MEPFRFGMNTSMKMKMLAVALGLLVPLAAPAKDYVVKSPSGHLVVKMSAGKELTWQVSFKGHEIIQPSRLAVKLDNGTTWGNDAPKGRSGNISRTLPGINYRKAEIADNYTFLVLKGKGYSVELRAYDDAAAYRFIANAADSLTVENETVEYHFDKDYEAFVPYVNDLRNGERYSNSFEAYYDRLKISQMPPRNLALVPFVVVLDGGIKAALTSVGELDYPGMYVHSEPSEGCSLVGEFPGYPDWKNSVPGKTATENFTKLSRFNYIARIGGRQALPWRAVIVSDNDARLADCDLTQKLCRPVAKGDWSWVKPGKAAWEWWNAANIVGVDFNAGSNTATYKYYVDFAAKYHLEYIIVDGGWSGKDITEAHQGLDMQELLSYARGKGVGIILWASWKQTREKMHDAFPLYEKWGVKGVKIDFVDANDQYAINSVREMTELAARHHLVVDWHGMMLNGMQVVYPNILNVEGVRGLEQCKWQSGQAGTQGADMPGYDVTIPFARMLTSPMDYTPGAMRNATRSDYRNIFNNPMSQGTRVHQMAMYTIFDGPLQMLCDKPSLYELWPDCIDFMSKVPTVFDDSRTLQGEIGKYIVTARRKDSTWFIGAITNWDERELELRLDFLDDAAYKAVIFRDGTNASRSAEDYKREETTVKKGDVLRLQLKSGGGWTARLEKILR